MLFDGISLGIRAQTTSTSSVIAPGVSSRIAEGIRLQMIPPKISSRISPDFFLGFNQ